ncbi:MAG TPA: flagellin [Acidobacteriota bacterium]|nr:flagellin [Acidobacteriota bacterium]
MSGFSVVNNLPGIVAQQQGSVNQSNLQKTLYRLSSGLRVNRGGDDAAGLAIADGLKGQIRTLQQSVRNANDGIGFIQVADSALGQVSNLLIRAATLLSQAASDTNNAGESSIETELAQIYQEIDRLGSATKYNGVSIFSGTTINIFVGDTQNLDTATAQVSFTSDALSVSGLNISTGVISSGASLSVDISGNAASMLSEVQQAIDTISNRRGNLGAKMNRLENSVAIMQSQIENLTAAESQIRDANMAEEVANLTKYQILSQVSLSAMAQANAVPQGVLSLLQ